MKRLSGEQMIELVEASQKACDTGLSRLLAAYPGAHWHQALIENVRQKVVNSCQVNQDGRPVLILFWNVFPVGTLQILGAAKLIEGEDHTEILDAVTTCLARSNKCQFAACQTSLAGFARTAKKYGWKPEMVSLLKEIS